MKREKKIELQNQPSSKQASNPDIRLPKQQKVHKPGDFLRTPPIPRSFESNFTPDALKAYHKGTMNYTYRGVPCLKNPIDLALYMLIIQEVKPKTILEIGSFQGGAALFYRDFSRGLGMDIEIMTVDFRSNQLNETFVEQEGIGFLQADAENLADSGVPAFLETAPRPWMIIEDSAHTFDVSFAVLDFFKDRLQKDELLIIEDGIIEHQGGNWRYDGGPNRAIHEFFRLHKDVYRIDEYYNDFFGYNFTFNTNGFLRKN